MEPDQTDPVFSAPSGGGAAAASLAAGQTVGGGRYRLKSPLGRGGMGVVWLVEDLSLGEGVALKFLLPEISHDAVALDELRREVRKSRKLTHPNIIRIHDFHEPPGETPFISMEYVSGENLNALRLKQPDRVFTWEFLAPLVRQLCDALDYAHGEKVIHRDLKPANMMLDGKGRLKLADFGIAALVSDSSSSRIAVSSPTSGTVTHMSPQQLDGGVPCAADDVYALGATLYELLTSRPPFYSGDIAHQVRTLPAKPLNEQLAENFVVNPIPPAVGAMVLACLAKDPAQRPASARTVAGRVGLALDANGSAAGVGTEFQSIRRWRKTAIAGGVAVAVMLLGIGVWPFGFRRGKTENGDATQRPANLVAATAPVPDAGWISLFDGRTLTGWDGDPRYWSVKEGAICGDLPAGIAVDDTTYLIWRGGTVADFELRLLVYFERGKSGVYYRATDRGGWKVAGYEFNFLNPRTGGLAMVSDEGGKARNLRYFEREDYARDVKPYLKEDDWNEITIRAAGNRLQHHINGHVVVDVTDTDPEARASGRLAFQLRQGRFDGATAIRFKGIRLRRLAPEAGRAK
ncbi:MAG: DUF1080 domain-containing protein [Verrucomicrobia bacterium]|nr:DUF1080 domain-containing protein [Verrucomicrobiota bacterium]